jgi:phosphate transport system substrate-binding protein
MLKSPRPHIVASLALVVAYLLGCETSPGVRVKGSDTMANLASRWAVEYSARNPRAFITIDGGGSGRGISALVLGATDLATASRPVNERERVEALEAGVELDAVVVAMDGVAVIVHPSNSLDSLTLDDLRRLFTGEATNFAEVGGPDLRATLYGREGDSGTHQFFKHEALLGAEFARSEQRLQGTAALAEAVARDPSGVAYGGVGYFAHRDDVKILAIGVGDEPAVKPAQNGVANYESVWRRVYPLSRDLYFVRTPRAADAANEFIAFALGDEGQRIVEEMKFIPLPPEHRRRIVEAFAKERRP